AMRRARDVIPPHVRWNWNVLVRARTDQGRTQVERPRFRRTVVLHDLRAGVARAAAIEHPLRRQSTNGVGVIVPPLRALTAGLVQLLRAVRQRETDIERDPLARDNRPRAVVHLALRIVLREAE